MAVTAAVAVAAAVTDESKLGGNTGNVVDFFPRNTADVFSRAISYSTSFHTYRILSSFKNRPGGFMFRTSCTMEEAMIRLSILDFAWLKLRFLRSTISRNCTLPGWESLPLP